MGQGVVPAESAVDDLAGLLCLPSLIIVVQLLLWRGSKGRGNYNKVAGARNNVDTELYFMLNVNEIMITADHSYLLVYQFY